ncbi:MAG: hypothetical protein V4713_18915 [Pseudomonadota bacterium]
MSSPTFDIGTSHLDRFCKATLTTLKEAGMDKADTPYVIDATVVSASEFSHLLKHGAVSATGEGRASPRPVLRNYAMPRGGPQMEKIGFNLNFDLL